MIARCEQLALLTETPGLVTRRYLTPQHQLANQQVADWMTEAGMSSWQDEVGNQWARYEAAQAGAPALVLGSHLDTVPNAGRFDGIIGVMMAIELVDQLHCMGRRFPFAIEVVGFCDEEGSRFGTTLIGSGAMVGGWKDDWLSLDDVDGVTMRQALLDFGLDPDKAANAARKPKDILGYWEVHIEQGPLLESEDLPLGVVSAIAGARRATVTLTGMSGHAGTTPMHLRKDALAGAAELVLAVESLTNKALQKLGDDLVATVGQIFSRPGAVNVIAGAAAVSLDVRSQNDKVRDLLLERINSAAEAIAGRRNLGMMWRWEHSAKAVECFKPYQEIFTTALGQCGLPIKILPSGAGHDAMAMEGFCPMAMLFLRSPGGISHHPDEGVVPYDVAKGLQVMLQALENFELSC